MLITHCYSDIQASKELCSISITGKISIHAIIFQLFLFQAVAMLPARDVFAIEPVDSFEDFSLSGWTIQNLANAAIDLHNLGVLQASFQNDLEIARHDLEAAWNTPKARDAAAAHLENLLFLKDLQYAILPIGKGVNKGWDESQAFNRLSGAPLDGGITPAAIPEYVIWITTMRGHLGAYGNDLALLTSTNILPALELSQSAYLRYTEIRDQYELSRFLPLPKPRLATDGSPAFKKQRIDIINPYQFDVNQRGEIGTRLRALVGQRQQMLECIYGPVRDHYPEREINRYSKTLFWYRMAPRNIKELQESDLNGNLAAIGNEALNTCPTTYAQAKALQAANVARHPFTARQNVKKEAAEAQIIKIKQECGGNPACERRRVRESVR
jgi:hypothetical protein